jgi:hypothetical protein
MTRALEKASLSELRKKEKEINEETSEGERKVPCVREVVFLSRTLA